MATQPRNLTQPYDGNNWKFNNVQNIISPSGNAIVISANNSPAAINAALNIDVSGNLNVNGLFKLPLSSSTAGAATGSIRFNTTTSSIQFFNGTSWQNATAQVTSLTISAGLTSYYTISYADSTNASSPSAQANGFTIYTFKWNSATTPGTTISGTITPNFASTITYLVVAGGGAGGGRAGGGGGAGGLLTGTTSVTSGTPYNVQVGQGGLAGTSGNGSVGGPGTSSIFNVVTAAGGGGGGSYTGPSLPTTGGSGGGGYDGEVSGGGPGSPAGAAGTPGQGNAGGYGVFGGGFAGGGGGGAGAVGGNAVGTASAPYGPGLGATSGGAGGVGSAPPNITAGSAVYYAGGGGGGIAYLTYGGPGGTGGNGGGGAGASGPNVGPGSSPAVPATSPIAGTNGLGGGGGGGGFLGESVPQNYGANGGSGVVILRIPSYV